MTGIPFVVEQTHRGERSCDIYSRLLMDRIILLSRQVDDSSASAVIAQMLFLAADDPKRDIHFYINSPGGSITSGLAIYDTMQLIVPDVNTICIGLAASMGSFLLAAGTRGKRQALPNSEVLVHQPTYGVSGQATDIKIHTDWLLRMKEKLNRIYSELTGQSMEKIGEDLERDRILSAEEAKDYGLIDEIMYPGAA